MKHLLLFVAFSGTLVPASALQLKDLLGEWNGRRTETQNGRGIIYKDLLFGTKLADGTIRLVERDGDFPYVSTCLFRKNGKFFLRTTYDSTVILGSYQGTWKSKSGQILITAKGSAGQISGTISGSKSGFRYEGKVSKTKISIKASGK